jgi:hypothetical protein
MTPMKVLLSIALVLGLAAAPKAVAAETRAALELKPKSALAASAPAPAHTNAPFIVPTEEPVLDFVPRDLRRGESRSSCKSDRALCYDADSGHIVYKPARLLMPDIPGLQRENLSVKRDKLVLRYSF